MKIFLSYLWRPLILMIAIISIITLLITASDDYIPMWLSIWGAIIIFLILQVLIGMDVDGRFHK